MSNLLIELREMADAYLVTHQWDERDAETCANAATEIESLTAKVKELEASNQHLRNALADTEALELGTCERLAKTRAMLTAEQSKVKVLTDAINEIANWLVCASIASADDMAQSFSHMYEVADKALATVKGE